MKIQLNRFWFGVLSGSLFAADLSYAQGTSFTYQGRLNDGANPANGSYDLRFALFDASSFGVQQGSSLSNFATGVSNGLFTVSIDFGNQFPGANRWLEIAVRTNGGGAFTTLTPRQILAAVPYAVTAGAVVDGGLSGNGANVTNVNAAGLSGIASSGFWKTNGNAGATSAFLGTTDNLPLEFKVNGSRSLRLEPNQNSPNVVGGYVGNTVSNGFYGAFIGGGGNSNSPNRVGGYYASILGGVDNIAIGDYSTAAGFRTMASGGVSTAMGAYTTASGAYSTALGVFTIASGYASTALGNFATAGGYSSVALGFGAKAIHAGSFVWGDFSGGEFFSSGDNQFCIRASGGVVLDGSTKMYFGSTLSQKIHLYGTDWAIGIQSGTQYYRVGAGGVYAWYAGGTHNNNTLNSGGGTTLMTLTSGGLTVNGTFVSASDRNVKDDFQPVDSQAVLEKVVALPLSQWRYKTDEERSRHLGPMAQDFKAAFDLGADDKHIATVDADGVALAAIQGLNQKVEREASLRQKLEAENAEMKQQLRDLKILLQQLSGKR